MTDGPDDGIDGERLRATRQAIREGLDELESHIDRSAQRRGEFVVIDGGRTD